MDSQKHIMIVLIALISTLTFFLGFPQFYYAAALLIALLVRAIRDSRGLLSPVDSAILEIPLRSSFRRAAAIGPVVEDPATNRRP